MNVLDILSKCNAQGVTVALNGDNLKITAKDKKIPAQIVSLLKANKAQIVAFLTEANFNKQGVVIPSTAHLSAWPLSYAQQRMWFLSQYMGPSAVYNMPLALVLPSDTNQQILRQCLQRIVNRHQALRTRFVDQGDGPVQVVDEIQFDLPVESIDGQRQLKTVYQAERNYLFSLSNDRLCRMRLLAVSQDSQPNTLVLLITLHHSISDGWSLMLLHQELAALYEALLQGLPDPLPPLPIQYTDYAHWQRQWLQGDVLEQQLNYWRQQLADLPQLLNLPTDRPRPAEQTFNGRTLALQLPLALTQQLEQLAKNQDVSLFMLLLSAFSLLLSRCSGQQDIAVGTPIANRELAATKGLIGYFANTLVMRSRIEPGQQFKQLLQQVRLMTLQSYAHQDVPFELLVEQLRPERSTSHSPLFQVMFTLGNGVAQNSAPSPLPVKPLEFDDKDDSVAASVARFDITCSVDETPDGLVVGMEYNSDLFDAVTIERMMAYYRQLLHSVVAAPQLPVSQLDYLDDGQKQQLLQQLNQTQVDIEPRCIHQLFEAQAAIQANAIAVLDETPSKLSYAQLNGQANRLARHLRRCGVSYGTRVGICVERSADMLVGLLAILKAGGCYVPLDPALPISRLSYMVQNSALNLLLTQPSLRDIDFSVDIERVMLAPPEGESSENLDLPIAPAALAYVIYTSGSTGKPKGVQVSHGNVVNFLTAMGKRPGMNSDDRLLAVTTLSFDIAGLELFLPLSVGASVDIAGAGVSGDGQRLAARLNAGDITLMQATPVTWKLLLENHWQGKANLKALVGGEAFSPQLAEALSDKVASLWNMYGPTETTIWSTIEAVEGQDSSVAIGRPIANTEIYVLDPQMQPCGLGVAGELYLGGDGLSSGYWQRGDLTALAFVPHPFSTVPGQRLYRTGDLVCLDGAAKLRYLSRIDQQIKLRGFRIELGEIEAVINSADEVKECVAIVREDEPGNQQLSVYVVTHEPPQPELVGQLKALAQAQLPSYMVPTAVVTLAAWPLTGNGKIDRKALPAPDRSSALAQYREPQGVTESLLATLWGEVLGLEQVGRDDNFFDLGGHSLLVTRLLSRIEEAFAVAPTLRRLFEHQTLIAQAQLIQTAKSNVSAAPSLPLVAQPEAGPKPLSYAQQRLWFLGKFTGPNAAYNIPLALSIDGSADSEILIKALYHIIERHQTLRTRFVENAQGVWQVVDEQPLKICVETVTTAQALAQICREEHDFHFDMTGQLTRIRLLQYQQQLVLLVTLHHSIADGWSTGILLDELTELYGAFSRGEASPLPPLAIQYSDFAQWQRQYLQGERMAQQLDYWQAQLADLPPLLSLPYDHERPQQQSYNGRFQPFSLPLGLAAQLQQLSKSHNATLFMTLQSAFAVLLSRLSGQDDIAVGTPIANRTRVQTERLIGFFVNTLVLRTDLCQDPTFVELLKQTRETALQGYGNQDIPFEQLVEVLRPERSPAHSPLFQVMFILQNTPAPSPQGSALALSSLQLEPQDDAPQAVAARFDLTLTLQEGPDGIFGSWEYNSDLFADSSIKRWISHYLVLLESIVANPQVSVSQLEIFDHHTRQPLLPPPAATIEPVQPTVQQWFEHQVRQKGAAIALRHGEQSLSYQQLNVRANGLANYLLAQGLALETMVGLCFERGIDLIVAMLGVLKAGGAYVAIEPDHPDERIEHMLADSQIDYLLVTPSEHSRFADKALTLLPWGEGGIDVSGQSKENPNIAVSGENLCYLIYTSGSTGRPKGVMGLHQSVVNRIHWLERSGNIGADEVFCQKTNVGFVDHVAEIFQALCLGVELIVLDRQIQYSAAALIRALQQHKVTRLTLVPSLLRAMLNEPGQWSLPNLKALYCSGEALERLDMQRFKQCFTNAQLLNVYGSSEVGADVTAATVALDSEGQWLPRPSQIGGVLDNISAYVLDQYGQLAPFGAVGELYIGGRGLSRGYRNAPGLTAQAFVPNPFGDGERLYRTGDWVRYVDEGQLDYIGRVDHQVKIRGIRIELGEVSAVLQQHPQVSTAVVVCDEGPTGQRLVAYLELLQAVVDDAEFIEQLVEFAQGKLPSYMVPAAMMVLPSLPLNASGKVDRNQLPQISGQQQSYAAPEPGSESQLAQLWCEVLEIPQVGRKDNFFALGGHSLLLAQLSARIRQTFDVELSINGLFEHQTLASQAQLLYQPKSQSPLLPPLEALNDGSTKLTSFAQQRLWFLGQYIGPSSVYNMMTALKFSHNVEVDALLRALNSIIERHETLRSRMLEQGEKVQIDDPFTLSVEAFADAQAVAQQYQNELNYPFDLSHDSLSRLRLLQQTDSGEYILLATLHHSICDAWSMGIFMRELATLYQAFAADLPSPLAPLPLQYSDFAHWQRRCLQGPTAQRQLDYWRQQLAELPSLLELPTDRPRPAKQSYRGGYQSFGLDNHLSAALVNFSRNQGVTLYMTLLSAFSLLMGRLAGQDDVAIGTPVANRTNRQVEDLIGFFANTLVMRCRFDDNPSFATLLQRTRDTAVAAYGHQDIGFEQLVEVLQPQRSLSHSPLFQVMFSLQNVPTSAVEFPGLTVTPLARPGGDNGSEGVSRFDMTLNLAQTGDAIEGVWEYNLDLFDGETIARMMSYYRQLLQSILVAPEQSVGRLSYLTPSQSQQLLDGINQTQTNRDKLTLHQLFERQVARQPQATAVVGQSGDSLSYAELNLQANRLAATLLALGVQYGSRVGICVERSPKMLVGLLAILKVGACYVPLDPSYPSGRLSYVVQNSGLQLLLSEPRLDDIDFGVEITRQMIESTADQTGDNLNLAISEHATAYVIYTSGSTGKPKGVQVSHHNVVNFLAAMASRPGLSADDRLLAVTTLSFDIAALELFLPLTVGACVDIAETGVVSDGQRLAARIASGDITVMQATPVTWKLLLDSGWQGKDDLTALVGGEALPPSLAQQLRAKVKGLWNMYGPTETTIWSTTAQLDEPLAQISIGRPIDNTQVYVLDPLMQPCGLGVAGELYIGGAGLATGYWQRGDLTAAAFVPDPFTQTPGRRIYRTGDRVRLATNGQLMYLGRIDHQVKIRGLRIELGEIETLLAQAEGVKESLALVREDEPDNQQLVAYVIAQSIPIDDLAEQLKSLAQQHLPNYMVPSTILVLESWPLTANGKIDRKSLPLPQRGAGNNYQAPEGVTENLLAALWCDVLKLEQVGRQDNFFDLGGHSLLVTQLVARIHEAFDLELGIAQIFATQQLQQQAELIEQAAVQGPQSLASLALSKVPQTLSLPLSFAQQRLWFLNDYMGPSSVYNISVCHRIAAGVDEAALVKALDTIVQRQGSLRTTFTLVGDAPIQRISENGLALQIETVASEAQMQQIYYQERERKFDMNGDQMCHIRLLKCPDDSGQFSYLLLLVMHHSISDAWSLGVFSAELTALYDAFSGAKPSPLPALSVQYSDFAYWQRQYLQGEVLERQMAYWSQQLAGLPPRLNLPTDRPRPTKQTFVGSYQTLQLPLALSQQLQGLSNANGVTLYMTLMAAFSLLMARISGQKDVAVGTAIANRTRRETESLIGFFVNTLVIRTDITDDPSFIELLKQTRKTALDAYAHQDLPFEQLVERLSPVRDLSHTPLFQVLFSLQNVPIEPGSVDGLVLQQPNFATSNDERSRQTVSRFDLTLNMTQSPQGLQGSLEYNTDLFDDTTITALIGHFEQLLQGVVTSPQCAVSQLELLNDLQQRQQLVDWNWPGAGGQISQPIERSNQRRFDGIERASWWQPQWLANADDTLEQSANRQARYLCNQGVSVQSVVAVSGQPGLPLAQTLLALWKIGCAVVLADNRWPWLKSAAWFDLAQADIILLPQQTGQQQCQALTTMVGLGKRQVKAIVLDNEQMSAQVSTTPGHLVDAGQLAWIVPLQSPNGSCHRLSYQALTDLARLDCLKSLMALMGRGSLDALTQFGCDLFANLYGLAETMNPQYHDVQSDKIIAGALKQIAENCSCYVLDDSLKLLPIGVVGQLYIALPKALDQASLDNPFDQDQQSALYNTGILVRYNSAGQLQHCLSNNVSEGLRGSVSDAQVTQAQLRLDVFEPLLSEVAVVELDHNEALSRLGCFAVTPQPGDQTQLLGQLRLLLRQGAKLVPLPHQLHLLSELPRYPDGTVDQSTLLAQLQMDQASAEDDDAPQSQEEILLAQIWGEVLEQNKVGRSDNFFELGGHSLLGTKMLLRLKEVFAVELSIVELFDYQTLEEMAQALVIARQNAGFGAMLSDSVLAKMEANRQSLDDSDEGVDEGEF